MPNFSQPLPSTTSGINRRILLVDDHHPIHEDYRKILAPETGPPDLAAARAALFSNVASVVPSAFAPPSYELESAYQGNEAIPLVQQSLAEGRPFAMAFVDMRMPPGWDGLTTIERIWTIDPHIQMVICTAYSDHTEEEITQHLGHPDSLLILQKPFQGVEVRQVALNLTHKWELARQARSHMETLQALVESRTSELTATNQRLKLVISDLEASHTTIMEQNAQLHRLATRDSLTGCLNRRAFFSLLDTQFVARDQKAPPWSCIMLDIDHFKRFNDRYGHVVGDQVLTVVASHVSSNLRPTDLFCRYGGEEFCVMLPETDYNTCEIVAERLRSTIEIQSGMAIRTLTDLHITASFGIASTESGGWEVQHLVNQADKALYTSKRTGRNRVTRYDRLAITEESGQNGPSAAAPQSDAA